MKKTARLKHSSSTEARRVDHGQRRKLVADALLADIFQGHLKAGERLVIHDLAVRYEVSPTPIREALATLEGIGIVDIEPNCGAVVRRVTAVDVKEVCDVRRALECAAVKLACGRIDPVALQQLADAFRERSKASSSSLQLSSSSTHQSIQKAIDDARDADSRLHDLIAESCGNRFLTKELGRLTLLFRTLRDATWDRRSQESDLGRISHDVSPQARGWCGRGRGCSAAKFWKRVATRDGSSSLGFCPISHISSRFFALRAGHYPNSSPERRLAAMRCRSKRDSAFSRWLSEGLLRPLPGATARFQTVPIARSTANGNPILPNRKAGATGELLKDDVSLGYSSLHLGGVQILMVDGSVRFVSDSVHIATWVNLARRADGVVLGEF